MKQSIKIVLNFLSIIGVSAVLLLSNCSSLLTAKFESDSIGSDPDKTLPGNPSGDEITYANEISNQLEIVTTPANTSQKSLSINNVAPTGSISGHSDWLGFKSKSTNFSNPITFTWTGIQTFPSSSPYLLVDISDGSGVVAARLKFQGNGDVILVDDIATGNGPNVGSIDSGERYSVLLTVRLSDKKYNISIIKPSGNIVVNDHAILIDDITIYHNPARPTVSFKFQNGTSANKFVADEVFISRKN